jgi:hypothetical protein
MGSYNTYCGRIPLKRNTGPEVLAALTSMVSHTTLKPGDLGYRWLQDHPYLIDLLGTAPYLKSGLHGGMALVNVQTPAIFELRFCVCNKEPIDTFQALVKDLRWYVPESDPLLEDETPMVVCLPEEWKYDVEDAKTQVTKYLSMLVYKTGHVATQTDIVPPWDTDPDWFVPFVTAGAICE